MSNFFHAHVHSEFSSLDAISDIDSLAAKAAKMKQPAMALTDHGNMSGTVQLYRAGQKYGLPVFPGMEGYLVDDTVDVKTPRFHIGLLAPTFDAYQSLARLSSLAMTREKFHRFPRFDFADLAATAEEKGGQELIVLTGCYFGLVQQTLVNQGAKHAQRVVEMYARWFPNTFVEIQNHSIIHPDGATDQEICDELVRIAETVGLPVVATQDSHYCNSSEKAAHNMMKRMVYHKGKGDEDEVDVEFPGDSFHLATAEWVSEHHSHKNWKLSEEGMDVMLGLHDLSIPPLDKYAPQIPTASRTPLNDITELCYERLEEFDAANNLKVSRELYEARLDHELDIIKAVNAAGYFTLWLPVIEFCKRKGFCVEARGSANGSLVCYLLGITSVDPLEYGLLFERFMSKDRKKPPDIDLDVEDVARDEIVDFIITKYNASQIGTYQQLGAREEDDRGSVLVTYNMYARNKMGTDSFRRLYGHVGIKTIKDVKRISHKDYVGLRALSKTKVKRAHGVHPAGVLLNGVNVKIEDYIPTMLIASSGKVVTQFTGEDAEEFGLTKMDILGARTLATMRRCQELIGRPDPTDFSWIPNDDPEACKLLREGRTQTAIFQFEGYTMAKGGKELGIKTTLDAVFANALFRPACIESGVKDTFIQRRKQRSLMKTVEYPHPVFEAVLKDTNGVVLFQEQVLNIMRGLGQTYEAINTFFKIVKDSGKGATDRNEARAAEVRETWQEICDNNGIEDPDAAWHYIEGYTKYGFNKAHSTGYGVRSYRSAYLKAHYPLEYMSAVLETVAGKKIELAYVQETRRLGIRILPPDVNISGAVWTLDTKKKAIRKGLSSIKKVGHSAAQQIAAGAPYSSIEELIEATDNRSVTGGNAYKKNGEFTGTLKILKEAGALSSLGIGKEWND